MRYIDITPLSPDQNWLNDANRLLNALNKKTLEERKTFLKDRSNHIWGKLKPLLTQLSDGKCWYCETKLLRAPYHVDHFRPKDGSDRVDHSGYWWLAYDHKNYRLACPTCNSSGKGDRFPLVEGCQRALCITDNLLAEIPLLLDPTQPNDPILLDYQADGKVIPRIDLTENSINRYRVLKSIELYRLDEEPLKEERKSIQVQLKNCLELCVLSPKERLEEHLRNLINLIKPSAAYSSFSNSRLKAYRAHTEYAWVVKLLEEVA